MRTPRSLQRRVLLMVLLAVTAVWLVTAGVVWRKAEHELYELLDGHLAQAAALLVVQQAGESIEHESVPDAPTLHRYAPRVVFQVWHGDELVRRSAQAPVFPLAPGGPGYTSREVDGVLWRVFTTHGEDDDVVVHVGERVEARSEILASAVGSMLAALLFALPMLALLVWAAVRQGMRPLGELARALRGRGAQELAPLQLAHAPSEIEPVVQALNALFERIEGMLATERRFTADAAHELRTPIAAIRAQAQVALGADETGKRDHALQATLEGCDRAARLMDQLLMLARLDAGDTPPRTPVDLAALARRSVADLADKALDKEQALELDAPSSRIVSGNEALLTALMRNFVDNAIRYCPPHTVIKVCVPPAGTLWLSVEDSGPGMKDSDLRRLGERFFRVSGNAAPGSGLGWSIAVRIAKAHGCQVTADPSPALGGLRVRVQEAA